MKGADIKDLGFYWFRMRPEDEWEVCQVYGFMTDLRVHFMADEVSGGEPAWYPGEFIGPIYPP